MLEKFRAAKAAEIRALEKLDAAGRFPAPHPGPRPPFAQALRRAPAPAVIAEYKRASPSQGEIRMDLSPLEVAKAYARGGAAALSVLTESDYFKGELAFLDAVVPAGLPILRKDFIFTDIQVRATAATPASALLLIARMMDSAEDLDRLVTLAGANGIEAVVEVFDARDLDMARRAGARIIQVNNRDLDTLETDLDNAVRLADPALGETWIAASGISRPEHAAKMAAAGFHAVLVGTHLMREQDPGRAVARLIGDAP